MAEHIDKLLRTVAGEKVEISRETRASISRNFEVSSKKRSIFSLKILKFFLTFSN